MSFTWIIDSGAWDMQIKNGNLVFVSGAEEVKQRILISLWHYWEEYFLNVPDGVPWYELILGSKNKKIVESLLRSAILDVPGVISILRFQIQSDTTILRNFLIYADVEVDGGQIISIFTSALVPAATTIQGTDILTLNDGTVLTTESNAYLTE